LWPGRNGYVLDLSECATRFHLPQAYREWPAWAKGLANLHQRARRQERRDGGNVPFEAAATLAERRAESGEPDSTVRTRPWPEWCVSRGLPRAPYADPADNARYRLANAIPAAPDLPGPAPDWYIDPRPGPEALAISAESLENGLGCLSERQRIVILAKADGWTAGEIARALQVSTSTVTTHLARARERLRRAIAA